MLMKRIKLNLVCYNKHVFLNLKILLIRVEKTEHATNITILGWSSKPSCVRRSALEYKLLEVFLVRQVLWRTVIPHECQNGPSI